VEAVTSPLLAEVLADSRDSFNARFAALRKGRAGVDPERLAAHLAGPFARLLEALAAIDAAGARRAAVGLFDVSLELLAAGLLGSSPVSRLVSRAWAEVLPCIGRLVIVDPRGASATVLNGAATLARAAPAAAESWLDRLASCGGLAASVAELRSLGLVLAWRCGQAQYREAALERWAALPGPLREASLGVAGADDAPADMLATLENPWRVPGAGSKADHPPLRVVGRCGGYRGLGGSFVHPPLVAAAEGRIFALDSDGCCEVHADCFGILLTRHPGELPGDAAAGDPDFALSADGTVSRGEVSASLPALAASTSSASTQWTLAATLGSSHFVFLVGSP
jgi:hypothetical protein